MSQIQNDQAMVVAGSAGETNTLTAAARGGIGPVDSDVERIVTLNRDQAGTLRSGLVDILDEAVSWIASLYTVVRQKVRLWK